MSVPAAAVMLHFRLEHAEPIRVEWRALDGTPLDGYKAQITAIILADGTRLPMDASAIVEQVVADPLGSITDFLISFTGLVGYAADHPDRAKLDRLVEEPASYVLEFVRDRDGAVAEEGVGYLVVERPAAMARRLGSAS